MCGIYFPLPALIGVWGSLLGRVVFVIGYKKSPPLRKPGMMFMMLCTMLMLICSVISAIWLIMG